MIYTQEVEQNRLTLSRRFLEERKGKNFYSSIRATAETVGMGIISLDLALLSTYSIVMHFAFNMLYPALSAALIVPAVMLAPVALVFAGYSVVKANESYNSYAEYKKDKELAITNQVKASTLDKGVRIEFELHNLIEVVTKKMAETDAVKKVGLRAEEKIYIEKLMANFSKIPSKAEALNEDKTPYLNLFPYSSAYIASKKKENQRSSSFKLAEAVPFGGLALYSAVSAGYVISTLTASFALTAAQIALYASSITIFALGAISLLAFTGKFIYEGYSKRKDNKFYDDIAKNVKFGTEEGKKENLDLQTEYNKTIDKATKGNDGLRREVVKSFVDYVNQRGAAQQSVV